MLYRNISRVLLSQTKHVHFPYQLTKHTNISVGTENIYEISAFTVLVLRDVLLVSVFQTSKTRNLKFHNCHLSNIRFRIVKIHSSGRNA